MNDTTFSMSLKDVKRDIYHGISECNKRGLMQSAKWLSELNHGLSGVTLNFDKIPDSSKDGIAEKEYDDYLLAKSYYDVREYDRAAYFIRNCTSPVPKFLHLYSTYMAKEKKRLDNMSDNTIVNTSSHVKDFSELLSVLKSDHSQKKLDGYCLYLYGVILKKLDLNQMAINIFVEAIDAEPTMWGTWLELAPLITDKDKLQNLKLTNHWMKQFFIGYTYIELFLNDEGLKIFEELQLAGFGKCIFIATQLAIAFSNKRDVDKSIEIFQHIQEIDPYRLDNLDSYSNLLFVKEMKTEMAHLAHKAVEVNKFRPETCCVIGNYYSIRADHHKAVVYFQRALKLNPKYLSAWTLMGHEFMEMKNTNAAIQSYRQAVEVNRRDFRAWYGLGQAYEILKMPFYSLHYYKAAQQLRPYDSRMLVALGETYEKLEKVDNALKCYQKAYNVGDIEGVALFKLAKLHEKQNDIEKAIPAYLDFCADEKANVDKASLCHAYITLGNYYEKTEQYELASHFAYKCLEHEDTKREAEALLKTIANKRMVSVVPTSNPVASSTMDLINFEEVEMEESGTNIKRIVDMVMSQDIADILLENDEPEYQLEDEASEENIGRVEIVDQTSNNMSIVMEDEYEPNNE